MNDEAEVTTSAVVATVYDHLLGAISEGSLQPGDRISDGELATQFGVSRTPVREAIQRLRDIGVIEASANRFTRVAVVSPQQTADAMTVWVTLYRALVAEVTPRVDDAAIGDMETAHQECVEAMEKRDFAVVARTNFDFFARLRPFSGNEVLTRSITGVVHMVRLGSLHLPEAIDVAQLAGCQRALLDALRARDAAAAVDAIDALRDIRIPQE
ncbi:GntR family transcriptional regulator [Salinibacterium sp. SYSU T00001]|uniref:GntR family transcriptional regulator n=1 Tax=Homoserinimonas sedimenticola TaxID=2986805 RepID=UPI00223697EF|nr:GntR family transcriptional regulator [Salinibacterium sedimenticola]MCW4385580.1 GntR family transcriptional regulator [Salinibacterium sedimenticola]